MTQEEKVTLPNDMLLADVVSLLSSGHTVTLRAKGTACSPSSWAAVTAWSCKEAGAVRVDDIVLARLPGRGYVLHPCLQYGG